MRRLAIAVAIFLVVVGGTAIALRVVFPPERIKTVVVRRVETASGLSIAVERAGLGISRHGLAVKLGNVVVSNPNRRGEDPVLRLDGLEVGVALWPLFRRDVRVTHLLIDGAKVFLIKDASGVFNAQVSAARPPAGAAPGTPEAKASLLVAVPAAEIRNLSLRYIDETSKAIVEVGDLDGTLRGGLEPDTVRVTADFTLDRVIADLRQSGGTAYGPLRLGFHGDLAHAPASGLTRVRRGTFQLEAIEFDLRGMIDSGPPGAAPTNRPGVPQLDLSLMTGSFEPAKVLTLLGTEGEKGGLRIGGTAKVEATLRGPATSPAVDGVLALSGVEVTPPERDRPLLTALNGEARFTRTGIDASGLRGQLAGNPFVLGVRVRDFVRPAVTGNVTFDARVADLAALLPMPPDLVIESGMLAGDVQFSTQAPDFAKALRMLGAASGKGLQGRLPGVTAPIRNLEFKAALEGRGATIEPFRLDLGQSDFGGRLVLSSFDKPALDVALTSRRLNLDELMGKPGSQPPPEPAAKGKEKPPVVPMHGTVRADELLVHGLVARNASLVLAVDERGIRLDDTRASLLGGTLTGKAAIDPTDPDSLRYQSELHLVGIEANEFLTALTPVKNLVYGKLDSDLDLSGIAPPQGSPAALLTALGHAAVANGHLEVRGPLGAILRQIGIVERDQLPFQRLSSHIKVERGRVGIKELRLSAPQHGEFTLAGSIGLDGSLETTLHALLPKRYLPPELANRPELVELLVDANGRVPLDFQLTGNARSPKVKLDMQSIEQQVASRGKKKIETQLKKEADTQVDKALKDAKGKLGDFLRSKRKPAVKDSGASTEKR